MKYENQAGPFKPFAGNTLTHAISVRAQWRFSWWQGKNGLG
jgi:hypothetical protein